MIDIRQRLLKKKLIKGNASQAKFFNYYTNGLDMSSNFCEFIPLTKYAVGNDPSLSRVGLGSGGSSTQTNMVVVGADEVVGSKQRQFMGEPAGKKKITIYSFIFREVALEANLVISG